MTVHKKNAKDKLLKHKGIKDFIVKPKGKGSFFRLVKIGLERGSHDFKHKLKDVIPKFKIDESGCDDAFKLVEFQFKLRGCYVLGESWIKPFFKKGIKHLDQIVTAC